MVLREAGRGQFPQLPLAVSSGRSQPGNGRPSCLVLVASSGLEEEEDWKIGSLGVCDEGILHVKAEAERLSSLPWAMLVKEKAQGSFLNCWA